MYKGIKDGKVVALYYHLPPSEVPPELTVTEATEEDADVVAFLNPPPKPDGQALYDLMLTPVENGGLVDLYLTIKSADKATALLLGNALTITWKGTLDEDSKIAAIQDAINDAVTVLQTEGAYTSNKSRIEQALADTHFDSVIVLP